MIGTTLMSFYEGMRGLWCVRGGGIVLKTEDSGYGGRARPRCQLIKPNATEETLGLRTDTFI